jgi:zinc protease
MRTPILAVFVLAASASAAPKLAVPKVPFEKYVLPNGLQVIFHVDKKLPLVHVNLWYHVGSKNEKPGKTASLTCSST